MFYFGSFLSFGIILYIVLILIPSFIILNVAEKYGRGGCAWFFLSLLFSPLLIGLLLLAMGETEEKRRERIVEEEKLRNQVKDGTSFDQIQNVTTNQETAVPTQRKDIKADSNAIPILIFLVFVILFGGMAAFFAILSSIN